jgi:CRISPR/Cas system-associated protein Cas5 (RAMP superfamily)
VRCSIIKLKGNLEKDPKLAYYFKNFCSLERVKHTIQKVPESAENCLKVSKSVKIVLLASTPEAYPTTTSYNANVLKIYYATYR